MSFAQFGLNSSILSAVEKAGYSKPTPVQESCIPMVKEGRDLIGIAQTGTGKTAAFVLPLIDRLLREMEAKEVNEIRHLILAPTRELAIQIKDAVIEFGLAAGIRVSAIYGGVEEVSQIRRLKQGVHFVVATPGRLIDLMDKQQLDFQHLDCLVLDEADRMLHMGFLSDIEKIIGELPKRRQTLMFSATLPREVEMLAKRFQYQPKTVEIDRRSDAADTVDQIVYEVPEHLKAKLLAKLLGGSGFERVLVFVKLKEGVNLLTNYLKGEKINAVKLHSGRNQDQRSKALDDFKKGKANVLVATDIVARGIDIEGVTHVINFDFPVNPEDYIHRIGRTGRAETQGQALSLVPEHDKNLLDRVELFIAQRLKRRKIKDFDYREPRSSKQLGQFQMKKDWRKRTRGASKRRPRK